ALIQIICIFNIFPELSQKCAHAHAGHTQKIYDNCRFSAELEVHHPQQQRWGSTGKLSAIGNYIYFRPLPPSVKKTTQQTICYLKTEKKNDYNEQPTHI
ncbi:MAG: hypothetical protein JW870_12865, partial [Candidatus Delongbacteria bacterium]|nr:hypothetical protein [Candidatus Delongbacteria bacterium]